MNELYSQAIQKIRVEIGGRGVGNLTQNATTRMGGSNNEAHEKYIESISM